ncbi:MAG: TonB-dependent receptor, partial [Janthinobacterium lividum]
MANRAILMSVTAALLASGSMLHAQVAVPSATQALPSEPRATPQADIPAQPTSDIQDIVVTATRQATNQQATPLAITAVTAAQLEERGLKSTADLSSVVPNATFRRAQGAFGPGVTAFIRGIGQADTSLGSEPAVAYYVDDVYYPLLLGSNFDLLDLDHIEVLRGPQGTLFGRNALAGAINIVSKQPSLTDASGYGQVTVGSYNRTDVRAGFNVPLTDKIAIQVGALSKKRTGYQQVLDFRCQMNLQGTPALAGTLPFASAQNTPASNFTPSSCVIGHQGGEDVRAVKGTLLFKPTDNIKLTISGDYTQDQSENPADSLLSVTGPGAANVQAQAKYFGVAYDGRFVTGNPYTTYVTYTDPVGAGVVVPGDTFHNGLPDRGGASFSPLVDLQNWGVSGRLVVGLTDKIDLTTVVGYRDLNEHHSFDLDASPLVVEHTQLNVGEHYLNAEMRLSGKSSLIDWVVGGFYFEGKGFTHAVIYSPQANFEKIQNIAYKPISKAVFANVTIKPLDRFDITLGGRYSDDKKTVNFTNVLDTNFGTTNTVGDTRFNVTPSAKRFDWKAGADYHVADNIMVYASASTGARLPGYNTRPMQPSQVVSYAGDQTLAYELGAKADLFDRRLRINGNIFYTDYKTRITSVSGQEANLLTGAPIAGPSTVIPLPAAGANGTT